MTIVLRKKSGSAVAILTIARYVQHFPYQRYASFWRI